MKELELEKQNEVPIPINRQDPKTAWQNIPIFVRHLFLKQLYWWKWQTVQQLNYAKSDNELPEKLRRLQVYGLSLKKLQFLTSQVSVLINDKKLWEKIGGLTLNENSSLQDCLNVLNNLASIDFIHKDFVQCILNAELTTTWHTELEKGLFEKNTINCIGKTTSPEWMLLDSSKISMQDGKMLAHYDTYFNVENGSEAVRWNEVDAVRYIGKKLNKKEKPSRVAKNDDAVSNPSLKR